MNTLLKVKKESKNSLTEREPEIGQDSINDDSVDSDCHLPIITNISRRFDFLDRNHVLEGFFHLFLPTIPILGHPEFGNSLAHSYRQTWLMFNLVNATTVPLMLREGSVQNFRQGRQFYENAMMALSCEKPFCSPVWVLAHIIMSRLSLQYADVSSANFYLSVAYQLAKDDGYNDYRKLHSTHPNDSQPSQIYNRRIETRKRLWIVICLQDSALNMLRNRVPLCGNDEHRVSNPKTIFELNNDDRFGHEALLNSATDPFFLIPTLTSLDGFYWTIIRLLSHIRAELSKQTPSFSNLLSSSQSLHDFKRRLENFNPDMDNLHGINIRIIHSTCFLLCWKSTIIEAIEKTPHVGLKDWAIFGEFVAHVDESVRLLGLYHKKDPLFERCDFLMGAILTNLKQICFRLSQMPSATKFECHGALVCDWELTYMERNFC
jgi:hypothetical protein